MITTIVLGLLAVHFAYIARHRNAMWGLKLSFVLIFFFLALRYNFGNDYKAYLNIFIEISQYNQVESFNNVTKLEPGWVYLNWLFRSVGFFAMIALLACFNCFVYYRFIKKYVPAGYYWLAVFIYIFYPGFMLIHSSAMRQSIAIMLFVFSLDYLYKKDAIRYFLCIGLASVFHLSALILLPVYLLGLFNWEISKSKGGILLAIFASLYLSVESLSPYLQQFISNYFQKYLIYQDPGEVNTGLGIIYLSLLMILALYFERSQNKETALVFKLAIISVMLMPLNLIVALIGRVGMYFAPATIVAYPIIYMNLKRPVSKIIYLTSLIFFITYQFFQFFYSDVWKDAFGTYQTILFAPQWY